MIGKLDSTIYVLKDSLCYTERTDKVEHFIYVSNKTVESLKHREPSFPQTVKDKNLKLSFEKIKEHLAQHSE